MKSELEVDSVYKSFGEHHLLTGCFLTCQTGDIVGILGRNGCGKSSFLKAIFGTLPTEQKTIRINQKVYSRPYTKGNLIGYLPQEGFLPKYISIQKLIRLFISDASTRALICENEKVHSHLMKKVTELSTGERRYLEILLLVHLEVKFILLDEPFSGLEPLYKERVKHLLTEHRMTKGFIITDHDYRNIIEVSNKLVLMTNGRTKHIKSVQELKEY